MSDDLLDDQEDYGIYDEDMGDEGFRVNMTTEEASSEGLDLTPLPNGKYLVAVTGVKVRKVSNPPKPGKTDNRGKPYFNFELTIQEGKYEGRKTWANAMLFEGALYTITQMLKAVGATFNGNDFQVEGFGQNVIPKGDWWMGQQMVTFIQTRKGGKKEDGTNYEDRSEPRSFFPAGEWSKASGASNGSNSLLPD